MNTSPHEKVKSAPPPKTNNNLDWDFEQEMMKDIVSSPSPTTPQVNNEPKYKVLTSASSDPNKTKIKSHLHQNTKSSSASSTGKDIFSQDAYLKSKNSKNEINDEDDFFGKEGVSEKQVINDDDFFDNDWDKDFDDQGSSHNIKKASSSPNISSRDNEYGNNNNSYNNSNNRYSGIGSSNGSYTPTNTYGASGDKYRGIGSSYTDRRKNTLSGMSLTEMSSSDLAFYLSEQAKDVANKTKEVSSYLGDQLQVVSHNVTNWFNSMMQPNEHK